MRNHSAAAREAFGVVVSATEEADENEAAVSKLNGGVGEESGGSVDDDVFGGR
jgi:hypothetical protein